MSSSTGWRRIERAGVFACLLLLIAVSPGLAWSEKGHLVVCCLAWLQMDDATRAKVTAILEKHPHLPLMSNRYEIKTKKERPRNLDPRMPIG
jgi:hypothetical protein